MIIGSLTNFPGKSYLLKKNFPNNTHVCTFIDEETLCWLEERVREELMPQEANVVLSIPLSNRRPEDTLIWQKSKNAVYTTKSAYRLLADSEALKQPGQSNSTANNGLWKKLWSLDIPNKVKHFLWRAVVNHFPQRRTCSRGK